MGYVGVQIPVNDGDFVVLFSDGAVEANNSQQEMLGFNRLEQLVAESPADSAQAMLDYVVREVLDFTDEHIPQDDFTVAVLRIISSIEQRS